MKPIYRGDIRELDGLRGLAIFLVLVHHFWPGGETPVGGLLGKAVHLGWMGVDLFFVISGFLICGILLDTVGDAHYFRNFYARRSLRIFPLYYLFLILAFTVIPLAQAGAGYFDKEFVRESGNPLWYFLYGGNLREALTSIYPAYILAPLWSLSIEEQFYITFPSVVRLLSRERLWTLLLTLIAFAPLFRTYFAVYHPELHRMPYLGTPARLDVIGLGCLIALAFRTGRLQAGVRWPAWVAAALAMAMVALFFAGGMDRRSIICKTAGYSLTAFLFGALVLTAVLNRGSRHTAILRWRPLTYLGKICYGTYLLHLPTEVIVLKTLPRLGLTVDENALWLPPVKIAATLVVASLSWWLFESRVLKLKDRFTSRSHPQAAVPAA